MKTVIWGFGFFLRGRMEKLIVKIFFRIVLGREAVDLSGVDDEGLLWEWMVSHIWGSFSGR